MNPCGKYFADDVTWQLVNIMLGCRLATHSKLDQPMCKLHVDVEAVHVPASHHPVLGCRSVSCYESWICFSVCCAQCAKIHRASYIDCASVGMKSRIDQHKFGS